MIEYPNIDPVAFTIPLPFVSDLKVHWYGIMYLVGFMAGWWLARRRAAGPGSTWKPADVDDLIFYAALGVIAGGRIGWCLVYGLDEVLRNPIVIFKITQGGMSFHGGLVGVLVAIAIFARLRRRAIADVFDFTAPLPGIGLLAGRIGNFINGELWGKTTDVPWGFLVNGEVRHPSQLYEAALEGLVLFIILWVYTSKPRPRLAPTGLFLLLYGLFRFIVEFVRVPDENMGYIAFGWLTTGQILSLPMIIAGLLVLAWAWRRNVPSGNFSATDGATEPQAPKATGQVKSARS
jgi:phosphatidylglycerol:prolipoprotein diacylglycerol transferase